MWYTTPIKREITANRGIRTGPKINLGYQIEPDAEGFRVPRQVVDMPQLLFHARFPSAPGFFYFQGRLMIKKRVFDRIQNLLQNRISFQKIAFQTGQEIPVICAISQGWTPDFPDGRPSKSWTQQQPPVRCDQLCAVCPRTRSRKKTSPVQCVVPADNCFLGIFLSSECAKRYDELHRKKVQGEQNEDWVSRCFPR